MSLAVIETHPVQYHAPVYRELQKNWGIPVTAIYGSDFSVTGYRDQEFGATFAWDTDLLSGYSSRFLSRVADDGASGAAEVTTHGLRVVLAEIAPQAVMVLGYNPRFHREAFLAARRASFPILFRGETTDHARQRSALKAWARDQALRWFYQRCERLLYVGQRSHEHFQRLGCPEDKLLFSPYCVDTTPFQLDEEARARLRDPARAALQIGANRKVILFSGKLSERKGPDILINAIKQLPAEVREKIVILFLGSGEMQDALQSLTGQTPTVPAHFLGFQNQTQLSPYYHAADLLVLPSVQSETWGLVVNDALHHGLPCVVSEAVGCAPDLIERGETGEVFETGFATKLAEAISRILPLTDQIRTRAKCREKVSTYTIEKAAAGIAQAFRGVVQHREPALHRA
jgi:glycosyltransferase involved in cell wall biosynthesis